MRKKLLGLVAALGITALASWPAPAVATGTLPPCTGRVCLSERGAQCACLSTSPRAGQVFSCEVWLQIGPTACF